MDMRVPGALFAAQLFCILIIGLSCGGTVVVIGGGSDGSGTIPTIDTTTPSSTSPRDPSVYEPPNLPTLPRSEGSPESSNSSSNESGSGTLEFSMISRVVGSSTNSTARGAGFSEWKRLKGDDDFEIKQASSAIYGTLDASKIIKFSKDSQESDTENVSFAVMLSQDQIRFLGNSYNDRASYLNRGDLIRNSFSAGAISKNSTYIGGFEDYNMSDWNETGRSKRTTIYNLDSRSVGISNFDLVSGSGNNSTNSIEISEQYSGEIALRINFKNIFNLTYTRDKDDWLPCCDGGLAIPLSADESFILRELPMLSTNQSIRL